MTAPTPSSDEVIGDARHAGFERDRLRPMSTSASVDFGQCRLRPVSFSANFDFGQFWMS